MPTDNNPLTCWFKVLANPGRPGQQGLAAFGLCCLGMLKDYIFSSACTRLCLMPSSLSCMELPRKYGVVQWTGTETKQIYQNVAGQSPLTYQCPEWSSRGRGAVVEDSSAERMVLVATEAKHGRKGTPRGD